jgi:hypothetical protein
MLTKDKLESYMTELGLSYQEKGKNVWVVFGEDKGLENVVVMIDDPIVIIQIKVMDVPKDNRAELFERLLQLNATDMVHGAYALEGESVVLINTLLAETMDLEELQASLDALGLALAQHYEVLAKFRNTD